MAIFDKIGSMAKNVTEKVSEKATDAIELTKLNTRVSDENKRIAQSHGQLGEIIFQKYLNGEELSEEVIKICDSIKESKSKIAELQEEIKKVKTSSSDIDSNSQA